ncbi:hypothetical protein HYV73_03770, partial [Candidatus Uhrbacteria bacterium]|nr:hypothetical protein [Candidatus Uhrbacteria bacterium]
GLWFLLVIALLILLGLFHVLRQTAQTKYVREGALITAAALMVFAWLPTDSLALGWNIDRAREGGRKIHWRDIGYPYDIGDGMSVDGVLTSLQNRLKPSDMESFHSESELRIALCNGGDFDLAPDEMEKQQEGVIRGNLYRYRTFFLANQQSVPLEAFNFNRWRFVQTVKEVGAPFEGMATSPVQCDSTLPVDVPYRPDSEILNLNTQPDMVLPYTSEPLGMPGR